LAQNDEAYEIKITPLISHESNDRVRKVEAVQTKTVIFFRYIYLAAYYEHEAVIESKIFYSEEDAIRYWNKEVANLCIMPNSPECVSIAV
jgi:hypothetical protein